MAHSSLGVQVSAFGFAKLISANLLGMKRVKDLPCSATSLSTNMKTAITLLYIFIIAIIGALAVTLYTVSFGVALSLPRLIKTPIAISAKPKNMTAKPAKRNCWLLTSLIPIPRNNTTIPSQKKVLQRILAFIGKFRPLLLLWSVRSTNLKYRYKHPPVNKDMKAP